MTTDPTDLDPLKLLAEAAQKQQAKAGGKGSVRKALTPEVDFLRQALQMELTLTAMREVLGQRGISVSLSGLRAFLLEFLHDDYTAYLTATGRGYRSTRTGVSLAKPEKPNKPQAQPSVTATTEPLVPKTTKRVGTPAAIREAREKEIDLDDYIE